MRSVSGLHLSKTARLTIGDRGRFREVGLNMESLRFGILGVGIRAVGDQDAVVGNTGIPKVLSLGGALVTEAVEL